MSDIYDTEGIAAAVVHITIPLENTDLQQCRDDLERTIRDAVNVSGHYEPTDIHIEFEGRTVA